MNSSPRLSNSNSKQKRNATSPPVSIVQPIIKKPYIPTPPASKKATISKIPQAYIKRTPSLVVTSPTIIKKPNTMKPTIEKAKPIINKIQNYPCGNCKCCQHIQPIMMEVYERQKNISKLLSNANIGINIMNNAGNDNVKRVSKSPFVNRKRHY